MRWGTGSRLLLKAVMTAIQFQMMDVAHVQLRLAMPAQVLFQFAPLCVETGIKTELNFVTITTQTQMTDAHRHVK